MNEKERTLLLCVNRPWGQFAQLSLNEPSTVKVISVAPHSQLSIQYHKKRDEVWYFLDNNLEFKYGVAPFMRAEEGKIILIPRGTVHSLRTREKEGRLVELSLGNFDEEDIIRLSDTYGRK